MAYKIEQVYTENPYVDVLVYNTKLLGIDTVLKMKDVADANETEESLYNADRLIASIEGTATWGLFDSFPEEVLRKSGLTGSVLAASLLSKESIPTSYRDTVVSNMRIWYADNYEELNNYYRMLNGLPPIEYNQTVFSKANWVYPTNMPTANDGRVNGAYCYALLVDTYNWYIYNETEDAWTITSTPPHVCIDNGWTPPSDITTLDLSIPVHKMSDEAILILEGEGELEELYNADKENRGYIKFLRKKINPYTARRAPAFYPIYIPDIDSRELSDEYKERLEVNRKYALQAVYSQAYKFNSDYFDNFVAVFIIINTIIDIISRVQEFIARKEIFDIRSCRYIFESNGVPYWGEIPLKYQIRMVKNLHTLLKYKSTSQCMVDICSLFGFKNISIFKYYLLRERKKDANGNYLFYTNSKGEEDYDANFELKFVKIPIDAEMDEYIRDPSYYVNYDEVTASDDTWDAGMDHDTVKRQHKALGFNYTRTKYFSVDAVYDLAKIAIQQEYFFNMLYDNVEIEDLIKVTVPYITETPIEISQLFTFLTTLSFRYYGIKDTILDTASKVLYVNGFNFKADMSVLQDLFDHFSRLQLEHITEEEYAISALNRARDLFKRFNLPTDQIPTFNQLMYIFKNNLDIRELLVIGMKEADNKRIHDIYKLLYDSLMTMQLTNDHFCDPETGELWRDEQGDATYTEWLRHVNPSLYYKLREIDNMEEAETKNQYIANLIDNIIYILEEYIDMDEFAGLFHSLPVVSGEAVKEYIAMVIDFYKSYKVHFLGVNTLYTFDDDYEGWVRIIDQCLFNRIFWKDDIVPISDTIFDQLNWMQKDDRYHIREQVTFDIEHWIYLYHIDAVNIKDLGPIVGHLNPKDQYIIYDARGETKFYLEPDDIVSAIDLITGSHVKLTVSDYIRPTDGIDITPIYAGADVVGNTLIISTAISEVSGDDINITRRGESVTEVRGTTLHFSDDPIHG